MAISQRNKIPQHPMLFSEIFDVWGIDFMRPFPISYGNSYILLVIDYVSRWMETRATKANNAIDLLKSNIFYRFGVPKVLISDQGSHFYNRAMATLLENYGVVHRSWHHVSPPNQWSSRKDGKSQPKRLELPLEGCSVST
ncbi:Pro-Pol polyprotein, partial [Mucuna pruriens]